MITDRVQVSVENCIPIITSISTRYLSWMDTHRSIMRTSLLLTLFSVTQAAIYSLGGQWNVQSANGSIKTTGQVFPSLIRNGKICYIATNDTAGLHIMRIHRRIYAHGLRFLGWSTLISYETRSLTILTTDLMTLNTHGSPIQIGLILALSLFQTYILLPRGWYLSLRVSIQSLRLLSMESRSEPPTICLEDTSLMSAAFSLVHEISHYSSYC